MNDPAKREAAISWVGELDSQLSCLSAKDKRAFFYRVLHLSTSDWSPGMLAAVLFSISPKYAKAVARKIETLLEPQE